MEEVNLERSFVHMRAPNFAAEKLVILAFTYVFCYICVFLPIVIHQMKKYVSTTALQESWFAENNATDGE